MAVPCAVQRRAMVPMTCMSSLIVMLMTNGYAPNANPPFCQLFERLLCGRQEAADTEYGAGAEPAGTNRCLAADALPLQVHNNPFSSHKGLKSSRIGTSINA